MTQSPKRFKAGSSVMMPTGVIQEISDIQYVHNRYQLKGISGWRYGIDQLRRVNWKAEAEKWRAEAMRQYPTPEAYEAACVARDKHSARADAAEEREKDIKKNFDDLFQVAETAKQIIDEKDTDLTAAEAREQRLKEAVETIKELSKWDGISVYLDRCYIEARDVLSTLYPDTPAAPDPNSILEQNGIDPTGWTWHTPAPKEGE